MLVTVLQLTREFGKTIFANDIDDLNAKTTPNMFKDGERVQMSKLRFVVDANNHICFV